MLLVASLSVLALIVGTAMWLGPNDARGDQGGAGPDYLPASQETPEGLVPSAAQTKAALESTSPGKLGETAETDLQVAQELPHRDLGREEALELVEGVFGAELEAPTEFLDGLEATKFLSDNTVVLPVSALPEDMAPAAGEGEAEPSPQETVMVESTVPLRTDNAEGEEEAVDLTLAPEEGSGGELQPVNPLTQVEVPGQLGEGVTLPEAEVGITVSGAPAATTPSDVEGKFAFYPEVAENTDLIVSPTATGVEMSTDIRSAEAPLSTTYELSLPAGAKLEPGPHGSAEVIEGGKPAGMVTPPSATDAAGKPVEASMRIEGDDLIVSVSPGPSTEYPILVDPEYAWEQWSWTYYHESQAAWSGNTDTAAFQPVRYAFWGGEAGAPGLDLVSGGWASGVSGGQANWVYTVPRYSSDMTKFGSPPTTWITSFLAENMYWLNNNEPSNYPVWVLGLADPLSAGFWSNDTAYYGESQFQAQATWFLNPPNGNTPADTNTKMIDSDLVTYENEAMARTRDAYIGGAFVAIMDPTVPRIVGLTPPTGWLSGPTASFPAYNFEDTGLGVRSAAIRLAGTETAPAVGGADFTCTGAVASPCPRVASSTESGRPKLGFAPNQLPTGEDELEVMISNPWGTPGHIASQNVRVKIDNTAPEISLSGALTEQERLGITQAEYPLAISVTDGSEDDPPQSGVSSVEVKVDGKKVTMPNEAAWHPACKTQDCAFHGSWTLKASEYAPGDHEVEVVSTDAVGHVATETLEVELGVVPPQTSFTSPHPTYRAGEIPSIAFKATRAGIPAPGATFRCSFDGSTPMEPCTSPFDLSDLKPGSHTFLVAAEEGGKADPTPARWNFSTDEYPQAPAVEKLVYPEVGKKTASYYTLEAQWGENPEGKPGEGVTGVWFQMQLPGKVKNEKGEEVERTFETVPAGCTVDGQGRQVSWPLPAHGHPGHSAPVYLKVRGCPAFEAANYPEKEIQFRAVFDGGEKVAGVSESAATEFVSHLNANRVSTDATESVGPATVDLLTGAFTLSRTDVSIPIPGYEANLEFTRTYSSTVDTSQPGFSKVLGGAWQPASPLESEYEGEAWTRVEEKEIPEQLAVFENYCWEEFEEVEDEEGNVYRENEHEECERIEVEPAWPRETWVELIDSEGAGVPFEIKGTELVAPSYAQELNLRRVGADIVLAYPNGTHTTFSLPEGSTLPEGRQVFLPSSISYQANSNSMRMVYKTEPGSKQLHLKEEISPTPVGGAPCEENETARKTQGCRSLMFEYGAAPQGTSPASVLTSIAYYGPSGSGARQVVAEYSYGAAALENGEMVPVLLSEKDPRLPIPAEKYAYAEPSRGNLLTSLTPAGEEPWSFEYAAAPSGRPIATRLKSVGRVGKKTTIAYEVPVSGAGAPYDLSSQNIATWGETDLPVDATAIFPPNHPPSAYPPHEYTGATVDYMDPEGYEINTASPSPPGVSGQSITTSETDVHGDVVRELSARNRLVALASAEPATRSHELDTHSVYSAGGNEMLESWGPLHQVRTEAGASVEAREHTVVRYDEGETQPAPGTPWAYLPTKETVSAVVPATGAELEPRVTETHYEWKLRKPTETIVDPGGLKIRSVTKYNPAGQVEETDQPKGASGGTAGDTRTIYYSAGEISGRPECQYKPQYANLPCVVTPAKQESGGSARPELPVKWIQEYNNLGEPLRIIEFPGTLTTSYRNTAVTYDEAGRQVSTKITGVGDGIALAREEASTKTTYSATLGLPTEQKFVCEEANCTGFDTQATTTTYNTLGQVTKYVDADGAETKTTYDAFGRPATVTDPRGTETMHYDEESGVLTSMEVSGVGSFTATYDADGDLIRRGLPNGLAANTTYNSAGEPTKLTYTKESSCGSKGCTWYEETLERSAEGRILAGEGKVLAEPVSQVSNHYKYDAAGRLTEAQETPASGVCTSRVYEYDADSNRLSKTTRSGVGGACATSVVATQSYTYDEADRLIGPTYDAFGRITSLPAEFAGGKAGEKPLETQYFANDMVAKQEQNGVSNTFQLDSTGRQRQREQTGGVAGVEVFHYDGPGNSPSWTSLGSTWSRNVPGIGGELAAVQQNNGTTTTTFELTDLHGDVVATASSSQTATALLGTSRFSEFGEPQPGTASGRFGWLGGKSRRTELQSGVIQMGARSYIPQLGRFLTPDPVRGGSAGAYDYANQDPVNLFDLTGEYACPGNKKKKNCLGPPSPATVRKANKTHVIKVHLISHGAAQRLTHILNASPGWTQSLARKAGEWKASEIREVQAKAARANQIERVFGPPPEPKPFNSDAGVCGVISVGTGGAAIVPGPQQPILGFASFVTGGAAELGLC